MGWQPIETYDKMPRKKRLKYAVFYFTPQVGQRMNLFEMVLTERNYGYRTCTHWMPLPPPPA